MHGERFPSVSSPTLTAFASFASAYCKAIDDRDDLKSPELLRQMHLLISQLYLAALALPQTDTLYDDTDSTEEEENAGPSPMDVVPDPDRGEDGEWRALYDSLVSQIGERCYYREVFDPYRPDDEEVTGSLADDFADIYRDLRTGLRKWDRGDSGGALWEWRFHFEAHWGEHATSAVRALYELSNSYDLPWPEVRS